jgi:hypothetical protein
MRSIIESRKLFATDVRFLNDPGESTFGLDRLRAVIADYVDRSLSPCSELREFKRLTADLKWPYSSFVSCFCDDGNLLSQWRGYARQGCALGFDLQVLRSCNPDAIIHKMVYSHDEQRRLIQAVLDDNFGEGGTGLPIAEDFTGPDQQTFINTAAKRLFELFPSFKHHSFSEERETRAIQWYEFDGLDPDIGFRDSPIGPLPYALLSLDDNNGLFALKKIVIGPNPQMDLTKTSVELFLTVKGLGELVTVEPSATEYRWF